MARDANPKHPWLYVAGFSNNVVNIYDQQRYGAPLIGSLTQGMDNPCGLALDSQGTLYVTNDGANTVEVFPAGATAPSVTLSQDLDLPVAVAVDTNGDVYVANDSATNPGIAVFPAGQTTPSAFITSSLLPQPIQMFFDASRNLYVSDLDTGVVAEMPYGSQQPVSLGLEELVHARGIALDPLDGNLYVNNLLHFGGNDAQTLAYAPGSVTPKYRLKGSTPAADDIVFGVVQGEEYMFLSNTHTNQVIVYKHNSRKPLTVLTTASNNTQGLAFKPAGVP